jgi:hypothetical protein
VADKKITIKSDDMNRLRELMRQEEEKLDKANPSDAELTEWEDRLEDSVRQLAKKIPQPLAPHDDEMARNWDRIQSRMHSDLGKTSGQNPSTRSADIIPFNKKPRKALPWLGLLAAAALVMIMVRPGTEDQSTTMDGDQIRLKGNTQGQKQADCEVDATAVGGQNISPTDDGQGFQGPEKADLQVTVRCKSSGFLQVLVQGPQAATIRNIPVEADQRQGILRDGKIASFPLQTATPWVMTLVLSEQAFSEDQAVPQSETEVDGQNKTHILWLDRILLRAQE